MKLLDWMHSKLMQNNGEEHKELSIRLPSVDDLQYFPHPSYSRRSQTKDQRESQLCRSFAGPKTAFAEDKHCQEDESADQNSELFHGFLTIGTFGLEPISNDPSTPTFSISAEAIAENKTEATENELKLINDQLEKLLLADSNDNRWSFSTGRSSHVSTGRSSHGSTITQSDKSRESADSNRSGTFLPLQEYLLRSANDFPESTIPKRDRRVSLGELFQKAKEENSRAYSDSRQKRVDNSAIKFIKKILKGKVPHSPSRSTTSNAGEFAIDATTSPATSPAKKMQKILHLFQRTVHREQASNKGSNQSNSNTIMLREGTQKTRHFESQLCSSQSARCSGDLSSCKREYWINSDSEYLVLEL